MTDIIRQIERRRGCGYRKPARDGVGIYLVGPAENAPCGRFPFPLDVCTCCGGGIKPARAWTWITPKALFGEPERKCPPMRGANNLFVSPCRTCAAGGGIPDGQHGLLWVGEAYYPSPRDFARESAMLGISRKLAAVPRGFKLGETVVYLAHRLAIWHEDTQSYSPGVFAFFRPMGIDLVIDPDVTEPPERAVRLAESLGEGARIIQVVRDEDTQTDLFDEIQPNAAEPEPPA